jgi:hypothetical protein
MRHSGHVTIIRVLPAKLRCTTEIIGSHRFAAGEKTFSLMQTPRHGERFAPKEVIETLTLGDVSPRVNALEGRTC